MVPRGGIEPLALRFSDAVIVHVFSLFGALKKRPPTAKTALFIQPVGPPSAGSSDLSILVLIGGISLPVPGLVPNVDGKVPLRTTVPCKAGDD